MNEAAQKLANGILECPVGATQTYFFSEEGEIKALVIAVSGPAVKTVLEALSIVSDFSLLRDTLAERTAK